MTTPRPACNRVSPLGEIIAVPGRGAWMGNRGRLHEGRGTRIVVRDHQNKTWITCVLSFKKRRVPQWEPNGYPPTLLLDEAVALPPDTARALSTVAILRAGYPVQIDDSAR